MAFLWVTLSGSRASKCLPFAGINPMAGKSLAMYAGKNGDRGICGRVFFGSRKGWMFARGILTRFIRMRGMSHPGAKASWTT